MATRAGALLNLSWLIGLPLMVVLVLFGWGVHLGDVHRPRVARFERDYLAWTGLTPAPALPGSTGGAAGEAGGAAEAVAEAEGPDVLLGAPTPPAPAARTAPPRVTTDVPDVTVTAGPRVDQAATPGAAPAGVAAADAVAPAATGPGVGDVPPAPAPPQAPGAPPPAPPGVATQPGMQAPSPPALGAPPPVPPGPPALSSLGVPVVVRVKVLVDDRLAARDPDWMGLVQRTVEAASRAYRDSVGLELSLVGVVRWPTSLSGLGPVALFADLGHRQREGADVLLGLVAAPLGASAYALGAPPNPDAPNGARGLVGAQPDAELPHLAGMLRSLGHLLGARSVGVGTEAQRFGSWMGDTPLEPWRSPWIDEDNRRRILARKTRPFAVEDRP